MVVVGGSLALAPLVAGVAVALVAERRTLVALVLTTYLVAWGVVVGVVTGLTLFGELHRTAVAAAEMVVAVGALGCWLAAGRPRPEVRVDWRPLVRDRALVLLAVAVAIAFAYSGWLIVEVAPNTWDSMTYHLPRAVQWLQMGAVDWIADAPTDRQNNFPPVGEIGILQMILVTSSDRLVEAPQFLAMCALVLAVFGIARQIGAGQVESALAGLLFATLSVVALQSTTTQNDLVVAAFVAAAAYFILHDSRAAPVLAGLATALALGTKFTALFSLPILFLLATRRSWRVVWVASTATLLFAVPFVLPFAIRNVAQEGTLVGGDGVERANLNVGTVATTVSLVAYRMLDLSGYETGIIVALFACSLALLIAHALRPGRFSTAWRDAAFVLAIPAVVALASALLGFALPALGRPEPDGGWTPNRRAIEDISYFGPLVGLLLAACIVVLVRHRRLPAHTWVLALSLPLFAVALALATNFYPWWGRYLLMPAALSAPLMAVLMRRRGIAAGAVAVGIVSLALAHAHNVFKPTGLDGWPPVWGLTRYETIGLASPDGFEKAARAYEAYARSVSENEEVGAFFGSNDQHFPLWDAGLRRRVRYLPAERPADAADARGLDHVVLGPSVSRDTFDRCQWERRPLGIGWTLLARRRGANPCP